MVPDAAVALLVAVISAFGAVLVAARRLSGKITTSDASELWEESRSMRQDYRDRVAAAEERQAKLEARVADLERKNNDLAAENVRLLREQLKLTRDCVELRDERDELREQVEELQARMGARRHDDRTS